MIKPSLIVLTILILCSENALAQQVFLSFGEGANVSSTGTADVSDGTGKALIYVQVDDNVDLDGFEIDITNDDTSVIVFTIAKLLNPEISIPFLGPRVRWDAETQFSVPSTNGQDVSLFGTAINQGGLGGVIPAGGIDGNVATLDTDYFDPNVDFDSDGVNEGAFLLGHVHYDIVGEGTVNLNLTEGGGGFFSLDAPNDFLNPSFSSGTLTVTSSAIPEPSSVGILALGLMGLLARRKRS